MAVLRLYTCFACDIEFETTKNAPKCNNCSKTLKGKYLSGQSDDNRNYSKNRKNNRNYRRN